MKEHVKIKNHKSMAERALAYAHIATQNVILDQV